MNRVDEYLAAKNVQAHDAAQVIEEFSDEIAEMRGKCIDIGCGPATVTREVLMPRLPDEATVVGVDVSEKMLDFAKNNHKDEKRLSFTELNVQTDKLPSKLIEAYDNAVSFYCLHWCQDLGKACKNIFDLLRPGGKALLVFLSFHDVYDSYLTLHENPLYKPYTEDVLKYIPVFQKNETPRASFKKMLKETGFEVLHCSVRDRCFLYKNAEVMKKHGMAINPFLDRMPEEIRERYMNDMVNELKKKKFLLPNTNNNNNESISESKILDVYKLMIAHIEKPNF